ncbi:MAG: DUF4339 domain-containing protein [Pirellulales bacterium]
MYRWILKLENQELVTVDSKGLLQMAANGELQPTDSVQRSGETSWMPASSVPGLLFDVRIRSSNDIGKPPAGDLQNNIAAPSQSDALIEDLDDDDDDDFISNVLAQAKVKTAGLEQSGNAVEKKGLVLAKDADGFERLMDARLVAEDAIVTQKGKQVKCPGCGNWFSDEKSSCPTCFRENWQGVGGRKRKVFRGLVALGFLTVALVGGLAVHMLSQSNYEILLPLELKIFLWVCAPFVIAAAVVWARKQAMN